MLYSKEESNPDFYYNESNEIDNYPTLINAKTLAQPYLNKIINDQAKFDYDINKYLYNKINSFHHSNEKKNLRNRNNHQIKLMKNTTYNDNYNTNINVNSIKDFSFWDKSLSNLSINKYKKMRENDYKTAPSDRDTYRNDFLVEYNNSINELIDKSNNINKTNDYIKNKNDVNESFDFSNIDDVNIRKNKNLKNRIKLNKEILNYNSLEKKINQQIDRQRKLNSFKKNHYIQSQTINYNNDLNTIKKNNLINEFLLNNIKISNINSNKKLKRKKGNEDDINSQKKIMKRNITFNYNDKEKYENINNNFIKYLKKDNQKLSHINTIYKQLIDTFFYFINQLSKKFSFKGDIKDINYYIYNANDLSNILIDLEQHLNQVIKSYELNQNVMDTKIKSTVKNKENKESDDDQELLTKSKFISMDIEDKNKKNEKTLNTRNIYNSKDILTQNNKSATLTKKYVNKTFDSNSLNYLPNINERSENINNKMMQKIIKIRKKNGKLMNMMNKLNIGFLSPKQKMVNNNINIRKNKTNTKEYLNSNIFKK